MNNKFIIQGDEFRMGRPEMHFELVCTLIDDPVRGGGWWYIDLDKKELYLYYKSMDYGAVTEEQVKDADFWSHSILDGYKVFLSPLTNRESIVFIKQTSKLIKTIKII